LNNKNLLLCISSAVIITIFSTPFNAWAQRRSSYQGQQGSQQSTQAQQEQQMQKQMILQGNSQGQQILDQYLLEQQQSIIKQVTYQIVSNPTQTDAIIRSAVSKHLGMSGAISAGAIKAVPEQAAVIVQAAVATCIPGDAHAVVYSAILAGADPATIAEAARKGGATSAQIKAGETRALQQLQLQQEKDSDTMAAKTKSRSAAETYNTSAPPSPPSVPKSVLKETQ
jgi:hypothetical protein